MKLAETVKLVKEFLKDGPVKTANLEAYVLENGGTRSGLKKAQKALDMVGLRYTEKGKGPGAGYWMTDYRDRVSEEDKFRIYGASRDKAKADAKMKAAEPVKMKQTPTPDDGETPEQIFKHVEIEKLTPPAKAKPEVELEDDSEQLASIAPTGTHPLMPEPTPGPRESATVDDMYVFAQMMILTKQLRLQAQYYEEAEGTLVSFGVGTERHSPIMSSVVEAFRWLQGYETGSKIRYAAGYKNGVDDALADVAKGRHKRDRLKNAFTTHGGLTIVDLMVGRPANTAQVKRCFLCGGALQGPAQEVRAKSDDGKIYQGLIHKSCCRSALLGELQGGKIVDTKNGGVDHRGRSLGDHN